MQQREWACGDIPNPKRRELFAVSQEPRKYNESNQYHCSGVNITNNK